MQGGANFLVTLVYILKSWALEGSEFCSDFIRAGCEDHGYENEPESLVGDEFETFCRQQRQ